MSQATRREREEVIQQAKMETVAQVLSAFPELKTVNLNTLYKILQTYDRALHMNSYRILKDKKVTDEDKKSIKRKWFKRGTYQGE